MRFLLCSTCGPLLTTGADLPHLSAKSSSQTPHQPSSYHSPHRLNCVNKHDPLTHWDRNFGAWLCRCRTSYKGHEDTRRLQREITATEWMFRKETRGVDGGQLTTSVVATVVVSANRSKAPALRCRAEASGPRISALHVSRTAQEMAISRLAVQLHGRKESVDRVPGSIPAHVKRLWRSSPGL